MNNKTKQRPKISILSRLVYNLKKQGNSQNKILLKLSKNQKERIKRKSHFFLKTFSVDQVDVFSELV